MGGVITFVRYRFVPQRAVGLAAIIVLAVVATGARCIENVAVRTDGQGGTYLLGEIYNDTDVQGTRIVVRTMLKDASGNILASKDTATCPPDLQPGGLSSYGVKFDEQDLPPGLAWEVRPIAGVTLPQHLPDPGIVVTESGVRRVGSGLAIAFKVRNDSSTSYQNPQLCAVMYDGAGKVGSWSPMDAESVIGVNTIGSARTTDLSFSLRDQAPDAARVRVWLWIPGPDSGTSPYQPVMTEALLISP
jgi:hypothetical protein